MPFLIMIISLRFINISIKIFEHAIKLNIKYQTAYLNKG